MTLDEAMILYANDGILHLASRDRVSILETVLSNPFDPELHYPLAYIHLHYAMLETGKKILDHAPDKNDETYKELEDFHNSLEECRRSNFGVFPLNVSFRDWWNGPHLQFPNRDKITSWFPLRVLHVDMVVDLVIAKKEGEHIDYVFITLPKNKFSSSPEADLMGEIAFYGEDFIVNFHEKRTWKPSPKMKEVIDKVMPYIKKSNELLNKQIRHELYKESKCLSNDGGENGLDGD